MKIIPNTSLTAKPQLGSGSENLHDSTRKHIHRKLESDSVKQIPDDKEKLLMVPDSSIILSDLAVPN